MKKFLRVLNAVIGFAGSSENPQKMSLRLMGIVMAGISQVSPLLVMLAGMFVDLPAGTTQESFAQALSPAVESVIWIVAGVLWILGAFRAGWAEYHLSEKLGGMMK